MNQCVQLKAVVPNIINIVETLKYLTKTPGLTLHMQDLYYAVCNGRMKLRTYNDGNADLIFYDRDPSRNDYFACAVSAKNAGGNSIGEILSRSLGIRGEIIKTKRSFSLGPAEVIIDSVNELQHILEVKVTIAPNQTKVEAKRVAKQLMKDLGVSDQELLMGSYIDLVVDNNI